MGFREQSITISEEILCQENQRNSNRPQAQHCQHNEATAKCRRSKALLKAYIIDEQSETAQNGWGQTQRETKEERLRVPTR